VGRPTKLKAVLACRKSLAIPQPPRRTDRKVVHADQRSEHAANRLGLRRNFEPVIQSTTFIRLEMTEPNVTDLRRIDDSRHSFLDGREHSFQPRVEEQRLVVFDEKVIELELELRYEL
jgi:hypothetical protein